MRVLPKFEEMLLLELSKCASPTNDWRVSTSSTDFRHKPSDVFVFLSSATSGFSHDYEAELFLTSRVAHAGVGASKFVLVVFTSGSASFVSRVIQFPILTVPLTGRSELVSYGSISAIASEVAKP